MLRCTLVLVFVSCLHPIAGQTWASRGRVSNHTGFFLDVMQELVFQIERRGFSSLRFVDYSQTLNERLYNWHVAGNVSYVNGFVVSIQKIDVTNVEQLINTRVVDGVSTSFATVRGRLNFRDMTIGNDVIASIEDKGEFRFTGTYNHVLAQFQMDVTKNLLTNEITSTPSITSLSGGASIRMIYMPANNMTEVLSRRYMPSNNWNSMTNFARELFAPTIVDVVTNKIHFPDICFSNCP